MLTTRWQPMAEMNRLRHEVERLLDRYDGGQARQSGTSTFPAINLWEDDGNLFIDAELPGFELGDLEIFVTGGNQLAVKGERRAPEMKGGTWHRQERGFGKFSRMIELPSPVNSDNVSAELAHGILTIKLPKSEEAKPRRIEVKAK